MRTAEDARDASDRENTGDDLTTDSAQTTRTDRNIGDESTGDEERRGNGQGSSSPGGALLAAAAIQASALLARSALRPLRDIARDGARRQARLSLVIRLATFEDIDAIPEVERRAGEQFQEIGMASVADAQLPSRELISDYVREGRLWVYDEGAGPVAFIIARPVDDCAHIVQVSVIPERQGSQRHRKDDLCPAGTHRFSSAESGPARGHKS